MEEERKEVEDSLKEIEQKLKENLTKEELIEIRKKLSKLRKEIIKIRDKSRGGRDDKNDELIRRYILFVLPQLIEKQDLGEIKISIGELKDLKERYQEYRKRDEGIEVLIGFCYARTLYHLIIKQNIKENRETIDMLKKLKEEYDKEKYKPIKGIVDEITLSYVGALFHLAATEQESAEIKKRTEEIEALKEDCQGKLGLWIMFYMGALFSLITKQDWPEVKQTAEKLEDLMKEYEAYKKGEKTEEDVKDRLIIIFYVKALVNLTTKQNVEEINNSIEKIKELKEEYKQNEEIEKEIVIYYALGLYNLTKKQESVEEIGKTTKNLKELEKEYKAKKETKDQIVIYYVGTLYNLIVKQNLEEIKSSIKKLKNEYKKKKSNEVLKQEIVIVHAVALARKYFLENKEKEKDVDFENLKKLVEEYFSLMESGNIYLLCNWENLVKFLEEANVEREENKNSFIHALIIYFSYHKIMGKLILKKNKAKLSHYTSMKVLPKLIKPKEKNEDSSDNTKTPENPARLRCYNAAYMNDPEEGKILYDYLRSNKEKEKEKQKCKYERQKKWLEDNIFSFTESEYGVYVSSLTEEDDSLPMWQQYGEGGEGCCLAFSESFFIEEKGSKRYSIEENIEFDKDTKQNIKYQVAGMYSIKAKEGSEKIYAYRISYIEKEKIEESKRKKGCIPELDKKEIKPCVELIGNSLWSIAEYFTKGIDQEKGTDFSDSLKTLITSCLDEIRYLFKSSDYKYEQEVRLLKQVPYSDPSVQLDCERKGLPRTYIEYRKDLEVDEVILGPKAPKREEVAPYIEYCNQRNGTSIKIRSSEIKYR